MAKETINELFIEEIADLLDAEMQLLKALPIFIKASDAPELVEAFSQRLKEGEDHLEKLHKIFELLELKPKAEKCFGMEGLIKECEKAIHQYPKSPLRDVAIIAKAQRIEHYEMAAYTTLKGIAIELGLKEIAALMKTLLDQITSADKKLTRVAEGGPLTSGVNALAK